jgi:3-oxoacyl-[acyl-carrier protein] reductase
LVTGGSGGIGAAICKRLASDGHHVYVHANRGVDTASAVVHGIVAAGGRAQAVSFDVTDADATRKVLESVLDEGPIQILVNNAGIHDDAVFPGMSADQWHRIINTSSITALTGNRGQVNYAAAKGALNAATKSLALEVASRGITVNAVAPGIIATPMSKGVFDDETIARLVPMKRAGLPAEVASLVAYLASDEAAYVTAQVISINGGMI